MLKIDLKYLFDLYGEKLVNDLIEQLNEDGSNASGDGAKSLRYRSKKSGLEISGNKYLGALSDGLSPSQFRSQDPKQAPSPLKLKEWVKRKVAVGASDKEVTSLAFAIARSIQTKGTLKKFGYGGSGTDFIKFVIDKNTRPLMDDIATETLEQIGVALEAKFLTYKELEIK